MAELEGVEDESLISGVLLNTALISDSLTLVKQCFDGEGFAFSKLNVSGRNLSNIDDAISSSSLTHLRDIDMSHNSISAIDCIESSSLNNIVSLDVSFNSISSVPTFSGFSRLRQLKITDNKLSSSPILQAPNLTVLSIAGNQIADITSLKLGDALTELDISRNALVTFELTEPMIALTCIDLSSNSLTKPPSLKHLPCVRRLLLHNNMIEVLDELICTMSHCLRQLDVSNNKLSTISELNKLQHLSALTTLTLDGNDALLEESGEQLALEVLVILPHIDCLNTETVSSKVRVDAANTRREREDNARQAEEEAAAAVAAAAASVEQ